MSTLLQRPPSVHSKLGLPPAEPEPIRYESDPEPFHPTLAQQTYDLAYTMARLGCPIACPSGVPLSIRDAVYLAYYQATRRGERERKELLDRIAEEARQEEAWIAEQESVRARDGLDDLYHFPGGWA